jgi:hypothetical protein
MVDLTFRTLGAWGAGKGANLAPNEVDSNFWSLAQEIFALQNNPAVPNGIATITVSGTQMTITLHDGTVLGPYTLPVLTFRWRGEWQASTGYAVLDVVTVANTGIYLVEIAHTSAATFDPNLLIGGLPAFLWLFGSSNASLGSLPDVLLTSLQDHDFLHWVAAASKWENIALGSMAYQGAGAVAISGGTITGLPVPANPADAATKAYVDAGPAGATAADSTMMSNISGAVGPSTPHTLSNFLDHVLGTTTRGTFLYRGGTGWLALGPGTSGLFLQTQGSGADPTWAVGASGVTSIAAGPGISTGAGAITATGTVSLAQIADSSLLANAAGALAVPQPLSLTQFLDHAVSNARGTVLTRNVAGWVALAPGSSGLYLQSAGAGADLLWASPAGAGTVTSVASGAGLTGGPITAAGTISFAQVANGSLLANISGATAVPTPSTLSLIFDAVLSSTQGAVLYRGAATWSALAPGIAGQVLQSGGAAANPLWANAAAGTSPIGAAMIPANLTAASAATLGHTLSDILDYIVSSSRGTLVYRGATGWTGLAPGTSGYLLSTGGPTADPSWVAGPSGGAVGTGNFIARRIFTANATYTPTTGTGFVLVTVVPGGGAGGGAAATGAAQQAEGSGGGSAGVVQSTIASGFSGLAIVVGAGGVAVAGAAGGNGAASSFGTLTAGGGQGGQPGVLPDLGVVGGPGGAATGGDLNMPGSRGWISSMIMNGGAAASGRGGNTPLGLGSGGEEQLASAAGVTGYGYGAGGSGAINGASQAARAGGNGAPGVVIVEEYGAVGTTPPALTSSVVAAGTDQVSAAALTTAQSFVSGASGTNGVRISATLMTGGMQLFVANEDPTNMLLLYPPAGATINNQAVNTPLHIAANQSGAFIVKSGLAVRSVP